MADPVSLGVMLAGTAASGALKAMQGNTQADAYAAQAVADKREAQNARAIASNADSEQQRKTSFVLGHGQAATAASGGGTGGSSAAVLADTAGRGAYLSAMQEWKGSLEGQKYDYEARVADAEAKAAKQQVPWAVGSTILTGLAGGVKNKAFDGTGDWFNNQLSGTYFGPNSFAP
jgi:hypothetical protein